MKSICQKIRLNKKNSEFTEEQIEIYKKALDIEKRSENFYRNEAEKIENEDVKDKLLMMAEEEKKHVMLANLLVKYVNRLRLKG